MPAAVESMVELSSGCICCSIDDYKFDLAIQEIIETVHARRPPMIPASAIGLGLEAGGAGGNSLVDPG